MTIGVIINLKRRLIKLTVASQVKQTLASLKGIQGTLGIYSNKSQDEETKNVFNEALSNVNDIIKDMEKRLQALEFEEFQYKGN
jgi:phosphoglycolate phosphatase-like HAD superfamily hydrolase